MKTSNTQPWRYYLRPNLRSLLILIALIGGWLGWFVSGARVQREAAAVVKRAGGTVEYDWEWRNGVRDPAASPSAPKWLVDLLGLDYFGNVVAIYIGGKATDSELSHIGRLRDLRQLTFIPRHTSSTALAHLEKLTRLTALILDGTDLTDEGLAHVRRLDALEQLWLPDTRITDDGLVQLKGLTRLKQLLLAGTQVGDTGLLCLKGLTSLEELSLSSTKITDDGLVHLKRMTRLRRLWLTGTRIGDAGLLHLKGLTSLQELEIYRTDVSDAGVKALQQALPKLRVKVESSPGALPSLPPKGSDLMRADPGSNPPGGQT